MKQSLDHPARFILCLMLAAGLSMFSISCAHPCTSGRMNQENHQHHMAAHSDMDSHTGHAENLTMATVKTQTVEYSFANTKLIGYLAWDDAVKGKRPGVLVVHEWWGLNDYIKSRCRQLAAMGYVAFAADMYGEGKTTAAADEAGKLAGAIRGDVPAFRGRINAGLAQLKQNASVDSSRVAAIGYCFGGDVALELARSGADIKGVVSFHGSLGPLAAATEKPKARVLVCHGADDSFVPMDQVKTFMEEMRKVKADYQVKIYADALHAFTNPDADKMGLNGIAYNAAADKRSWEDMKQFFGEIFQK